MSVLNPVVKVKETYRDFLESHVRGKTRDEIFEIAKEHIAALGCLSRSWKPIPINCPVGCASA